MIEQSFFDQRNYFDYNHIVYDWLIFLWSKKTKWFKKKVQYKMRLVIWEILFGRRNVLGLRKKIKEMSFDCVFFCDRCSFFEFKNFDLIDNLFYIRSIVLWSKCILIDQFYFFKSIFFIVFSSYRHLIHFEKIFVMVTIHKVENYI